MSVAAAFRLRVGEFGVCVRPVPPVVITSLLLLGLYSKFSSGYANYQSAKAFCSDAASTSSTDRVGLKLGLTRMS